jgi:hypothetical protein
MIAFLHPDLGDLTSGNRRQIGTLAGFDRASTRVLTIVASTLPVVTVVNSTANGLGRVKYQLANAMALIIMNKLMRRRFFLTDSIIKKGIPIEN